jgi:hypothetical protein
MDGTNEVEGIAPDVELPWTGADLAQFDSYAEKALAHADALFVTRPRHQARALDTGTGRQVGSPPPVAAAKEDSR